MIWLFPIFCPLAVGLLLGVNRWRAGVFQWALPFAGVPALGLAIFGSPNAGRVFPWLVVGAEFGFGQAGQLFLFFTSVLWTVAAIFARAYLAGDPRRYRFGFVFALCMTGNLGLVLAQDVPTFYAFFTVLALGAYPLIIHNHSPEAHRAGAVYLTVTIFGEALLLWAFLLAAGESPTTRFSDVRVALANSSHRDLILFLAFFGFGVKAGALPVHFWLPLAHPVAPVPASAVLSGSMIKAGLLGWMQLLPLGEGAFPAWSSLCMGLGLAAAFFGVAAGLAQNDPKTTLAYSSISQMGMMTIGIGVGLMDAAAWGPALTVLLIYALNHALAKGALFLGVGVMASVGPVPWQRRLVLTGLAMPALAIAGAPWTGGAVAKYGLKVAAGIAPSVWYPWMDWLFALASVGTALLLTRFLVLMAASKSAGDAHGSRIGLLIPWSILLVGVAVSATWAISYYRLEIARSGHTLVELWSALWPVLLGAGMLLAGRHLLAWRLRRQVPAGDVVVLLEWCVNRLGAAWRTAPSPTGWQLNLVDLFNRLLKAEARRSIIARGEARLLRWETAGFSMLALTLVLLLLSLWTYLF
jgi:formate hydrogenlyase subunit 3/multisubunit Na+/H+ antiporter MnhD subunit